MFVRGKKRMQIYREAYLMGTMVTPFGSPKPYGIKGTIIERHIIVVGEVVDFYYLIYIMREDLRNPVSCALGTKFFLSCCAQGSRRILIAKFHRCWDPFIQINHESPFREPYMSRIDSASMAEQNTSRDQTVDYCLLCF